MRTIERSFVRELPLASITDDIVKDLEDKGFTLVWKEESIEVWVEIEGEAFEDLRSC